MLLSMSRLGIRGRLPAGFATIGALLAVTVAYTAFAISDISGRVGRVVDLRAPIAITQLVGNLYAMLASLRGYLLTGDEGDKQSRATRAR